MNPIKNRFSRFVRSRICQYLGKVTLVAFAYFLSGKIAVSIPGVALLGSSVWPPAGIAQASLLLLGVRYWPGVALGAFFFDILRIKPSLILALQAAFGTTLQVVVAVALLNRLGFRKSLDRLIDVIYFICFGAIISTQVNSTLGPLRMCLAGLAEWSKYWEIRWNWFLGDVMGIIIFTPLLLILFTNKSTIKLKKETPKKIITKRILTASWLTLLVLGSWIVFGSKTEAEISRYPLEYLPFPFIIWGAIQFGQLGAVIASFMVSSIAIWGASQGGGPFIAKAENLSQAILFLQSFMGVITITSLLLSATVAERTLAENSLRESEIKYRELVENASSIIVKIDIEGNFIFVNEFAQKLFDIAEVEINGQKAIQAILPNSERITPKEIIKNILKEPEKYANYENKFIGKMGEQIWITWSNKLLFDEWDNCIGIIAIGADITERRKAELSLKKLNEELEIRVQARTADLAATETELRALFAAMTDVILVVDREGICLKIVSTNSSLLFKPAAEQIDKSLHETLPKEQADIFLSYVRRALSTKQTVNFEYSLPINGQQVWFSANISPLLDDRVIWVARDISDRKILEDKLRDSYAEMKALLESMPDIILVLDPLGSNIKIAPTNPGRLYPPEVDIISPTVEEFLIGERTETFLNQIQQALNAKQTINFEYNLPVGESEYYFFASITPVTEDTVMWIARDITDRKQAEKELLLEKERSEQLLLNILPETIANRLKQDSSVIAENFNEVTIMFADLVGFTSLSTKLAPIELVNLLNKIFSNFDQLVEELGLEKIKTIGDAYMVAGGLPIPRIDHAEAIADMALAMLNTMRQLQTEGGDRLGIRIGINTGIVVAGVIGKKKFIYDLWGDAVNVASRMESHGMPGYIQVTSTTYERLKNKYVFEDRGKISVKGKGEMTTYFLLGKKPV